MTKFDHLLALLSKVEMRYLNLRKTGLDCSTKAGKKIDKLLKDEFK